MQIEAFMAGFMRERKLTVDMLAKQLGYRSKAMVTRILKGNVNIRGMEAFAERLRETMNLTEDEARALQDCVEALRWQDDYSSIQEMLAFVRGTSKADTELMLEEVDGGKQEKLLKRYAPMKEIRITLLNSQYVPIFDDLHALITEHKAQVEHFLLVDGNTARTVHAVNEVLKVVYENNYMGYSMRGDKRDPHRGIYGSDVMVVSYQNPAGEQREDMIVFDSIDHGFVHSSPGQDGYRQLLSIPRERYKPAKRVYMESNAVDDYIQFSSACARLEYNRAICKFKPDFCVDYIPTDILLNAVKEGPAFGEESLSDLLNELVKVYQKRYQNTFEKHKQVHAIFKQNAMWKFVETGRLSDHFWGMRPFTPAERVRILQTVLDQMQKNPYFHPHFLKDDNYLRDAEVIYYEDMGILILDANTDYNLAEGHSEILVTHPEFLRLYRDFFMQNLVQEQVVSDEETCAILQRMIDACDIQK